MEWDELVNACDQPTGRANEVEVVGGEMRIEGRRAKLLERLDVTTCTTIHYCFLF